MTTPRLGLRLVILGVLWSLAVFAGSYGLDQMLPTLRSLPIGQLSTVALVFVWFTFGAKPLESAHKFLVQRIRHRAFFSLGAFLALVVLTFGMVTASRWNSNAVLKRALTQQAESDAPLPFFEPCVTFPRSTARNATNASGALLAMFAGKGSCIPNPVDQLLARKSPLFIFGEPSSGKLYLLKELRTRLAKQGKPSVLVVVRDCRFLGPTTHLLTTCIDRRISEEADRFMGSAGASQTAREFLSDDGWWLLIDGIDDLGDEQTVIPMLRELPDVVSSRGGRVIINGRSGNLAYFMLRATNDDEVRRALASFDWVALRGLTGQGAKKMLDYQLGNALPGAALQWLPRLGNCQGSSAKLANDILHLPGLLHMFTDYRALSPTAPCSKEVRLAIARWMFETRFEAYCRAVLCGSDAYQDVLRKSMMALMQGLRGKGEIVHRYEIVEALHALPIERGLDSSPGSEQVTRALIEIGILSVYSRDSFRIAQAWLPPEYESRQGSAPQNVSRP